MAETKSSPELSVEAKKNFIFDNHRILDYDKPSLNAFIAMLIYDERQCLSSPESKNKNSDANSDDEYTLVNLDKINSKEKIDMLYNFLYNKLNSNKNL
jgi:hypothetical protein